MGLIYADLELISAGDKELIRRGFLKEEENVHIFFSGRTARQQNFNINTQVNLQGGISVPPVISDLLNLNSSHKCMTG